MSCTNKAVNSDSRQKPNSMIATLEKSKEEAQSCINQASKLRHPVYAECLRDYTDRVESNYKDIVK